MEVSSIPLLSIMVIFLSSSIMAADPDLLQDICVADLSPTAVKVNGFPCKDTSKAINATDFFSDVLANPGNTSTQTGAVVTPANVMKIPGLNTLGISMSRVDYAPGGVNPPHTHPRATEIVFVLEGEIDCGFITTANQLVAKTVKKGEVFVFPRGLVHFQRNNGNVPAAAVAAFNSQLPGTQSIAATLFAASPTVPDNVLTVAFQVGTEDIEKIKAKLAPKK